MASEADNDPREPLGSSAATPPVAPDSTIGQIPDLAEDVPQKATTYDLAAPLAPERDDLASRSGEPPTKNTTPDDRPHDGPGETSSRGSASSTGSVPRGRTSSPPPRSRPRPRRSPPLPASWSGQGRQAGLPWTRGLLALAVTGPALALGGVAPEVIVAFLILLVPLWIRLGRRARGSIELPWPTWIGVAALLLTALQSAPLPAGLREALAPGVGPQIAAALAGTGIEAWPSLSPTPADTALEAARLAGLTLLFVIAAQLPWRFTAGLVSAAGAAVASLGLLQVGLGVRAIYGVYSPLDIDPSATPALLTTFVNPNHQADLFLLALFAAGALLVRQSMDEARDATPPETRMLLWSCVLVVGAALLLSLSRGALLALLITAPVGLGLAWISGLRRRRDRSRRGRTRWWPKLAILAALAGAAAMIARAGAWAEMMTLANPGQGLADKLRIAEDALPLHDLAPLVGVGRGAFIDLFPAIDTAPGSVIHTHLESAPATLWVEWGWAGVVLGVALLLAWIDALRRVRSRSDAAARAIALLGIAAVALHSLGDFSLEFLGVAAPAVALAGALAGRGRSVGARPATAAGLLLLLLALPLAIVAAPSTWSKRAPLGDPSSLRARPLDAHLHRSLARQALEGSALEGARHHATIATALRPGESSSWLLRAAAEERLGEHDLAAASLRRALATLEGPPSPALVTYLLGQVRSPAELGALLPDDPARWAALLEATVAVDPGAGLELATTRSDPPSPAVAPALEAQVAAALVGENSALAIHYARLLVDAAPARASGHLLLARALGASQRPRQREIRQVLEAALADGLIHDPAELGLLEEALLDQLLHAASAGEARALREAQALLPKLRRRPGDRAALQRRYALERSVEALAAASR